MKPKTPKEKYFLNQGIIDTLSYGGLAGGIVYSLGQFVLDSTPKDFTKEELLTYTGGLAFSLLSYWAGRIASKINKNYLEKKIE